VRYGVHKSGEILEDILGPGDGVRPGGQSLERLQALDLWLLHTAAGSLETERVHEMLTHVVDETAAVCQGIQQELLSYGASPPAAEKETESAPGMAHRAQ
jgi:hypothetical protein